MDEVGEIKGKMEKLKKVAIASISCIFVGCLFFYGISHMHKPEETIDAVQIYDEFLNGDRYVGDADIYDYITPTGEPDRRYPADYIMVDSTGDGIPELHLKTAREYTIFSCVEDEIVMIDAFFSDPWLYNVTKDGVFVFREDRGTTLGDFYWYFEMDLSGDIKTEMTFQWADINENLICDENDEFLFDGQVCTKEEWYARTREYLYTDEEGREQISNLMEWSRY